MFKPKDFVLFILSIACFLAALVLMPWSEMDMGLAKPEQLPTWGKTLLDMPPMSQLAEFGTKAQNFLLRHGAEAESNLGEYTYALVVFGLLTVLGVVYVSIGKEESEEKTVLPVK